MASALDMLKMPLKGGFRTRTSGKDLERLMSKSWKKIDAALKHSFIDRFLQSTNEGLAFAFRNYFKTKGRITSKIFLSDKYFYRGLPCFVVSSSIHMYVTCIFLYFGHTNLIIKLSVVKLLSVYP